MDPDRRATAPPRRGVRVGAVGGVPIHVSVAWMVVAVLLVLAYARLVQARLPDLGVGAAHLAAVGFVGLLFVSVLGHELGHTAAARRCGIPVVGVTLWAFGGYTEMGHEPRTPAAEFGVAVAGPAVSLGIGGAALGGALLLPGGGVPRELCAQLALVNLMIAVFNLLPGLPLDGGALVRAAVWRVTGDRSTGTVAAGWAGRVLAVLIVLGGLLLLDASDPTVLLLAAFLGVFLWLGATRAITAARLVRRLPLATARGLARPFLAVPHDLPLAEAMRRAGEQGRGALVVADAAGRPVALVSWAAAEGVPAARRPWVPVSSVARAVEPGMIVPADLVGEPLLRALHARPATEYLVGDPGRAVGVLVATDVADLLDLRGSVR